MFRRLLLAASCLTVFASLPLAPATAQETQPGDSCAGQTDLIRTVGGPENPGTGYFLVCDGTVWKAVNTWDSATGGSLFQVNTDAGSCTGTKLGRLRYDGSSTWEYCNGTSWTALLGSATAAGSTGYVQFKSSTGGLGGDSSLFWDDTNKRLGIGTSAPTSHLEVAASGSDSPRITVRTPGASGCYGAYLDLISDNTNSTVGFSGYNNRGWEIGAYNQASGCGGGGAGDLVFNLSKADNANHYAMSIDYATLYVGIGDVPAPAAGLDVQNPVTAASGVGYGGRYKQTITAAANNDALTALYIAPTFADASKTGVTHNGLIVTTGNVGIGTASPAKTLDVVGDIQFTGTIADVSDRRLKSDIAPLPPQLAKIEALAPVSFTMKDDPDRRTELGLIAQDVEAIYPDLVSTNPNGTKAMNYMGLIAPMIAAMQEQQREIEALRAENAALSRRLDAIEEAAAFAPALVPRRLPPPLYNQ